MTRKEFVNRALPLVIAMGDGHLIGVNRQFGSGSVGWKFGGRILVEVEGQRLLVRVNGNAVVEEGIDEEVVGAG